MPFHHVLVSLEGETNLRQILTDLSVEELHLRFVTPYQRGTDLVANNEVIPLAKLRKVHVVRTERPNAAEREAIHKASIKRIDELNRDSGVVFLSLGSGYEAEDLLEAGEDVTSKLLLGPPGYASTLPTPRFFSKLMGFFSNQWVVAVGTALVAAAILAWLGIG